MMQIDFSASYPDALGELVDPEKYESVFWWRG